MVDEENFRLMGGFNDIFIVIASGLLLFSAMWLLTPIGAPLAYSFALTGVFMGVLYYCCLFIGVRWALN